MLTWIGAFQSPKRKKKERYPGGVLALLQRETDTKTRSRISSETPQTKTLQTTGKPQSDRAPSSKQKHSLYSERISTDGYYPPRNPQTPLESRLNGFNPPR
jgi:hypothetical protein